LQYILGLVGEKNLKFYLKKGVMNNSTLAFLSSLAAVPKGKTERPKKKRKTEKYWKLAIESFECIVRCVD